jgi:hypothetical protein
LAGDDPEEDLECEMLDVLCNEMAMDDYHKSKAKEVAEMNRIMDLRAKARQQLK